MSIRAVIFDIGGVLELTPDTGWEETWSARLGLTRGELEARLAPIFLDGSTGTVEPHDAEQRIASALGLDPGPLERLIEDLWAAYLGSLNEELVEYFSGLRPRYRTAMLSNSFVGAREREETRYGLSRMCELIVYSHEEGILKPDAGIYRIAADRLGVAPESCVFLDDVPANVDGARSVGMHAVQFTSNDQAIHELDELLARD